MFLLICICNLRMRLIQWRTYSVTALRVMLLGELGSSDGGHDL